MASQFWKDIITADSYAIESPVRKLKSCEGSPLKRLFASFSLLLGLTFLTLTLYLSNVEALAKVLGSYVPPFP